LNCINGSPFNSQIWSASQPFGLTVHSTAADTDVLTDNNRGFCLNYRQIPC
jgi:hypothetical protein